MSIYYFGIFFETRKKVDVEKAMECKGNSASFEESVKQVGVTECLA